MDAKELKGRSSSIVQRKGDRYVRLDDSHTAESASQQVTASQRVAVQPETIRVQGIDLEDDRIAERVPEYLRGRPSGRWRIRIADGGAHCSLPIVAWQAIGSWSTLKTLLQSNQVSEDTSPISELADGSIPPRKIRGPRPSRILRQSSPTYPPTPLLNCHPTTPQPNSMSRMSPNRAMLLANSRMQSRGKLLVSHRAPLMRAR